MSPAPYCLPIIKRQPSEILDTINSHVADYQYFEVWLDYVDVAEKAFVEQLVELLGDRLIIVFRRQNLEPVQMDSTRRKEILNMLSNSTVMVDLDIGTQQAELDYIRDQSLVIKLLASFHDYARTPDTVQLETIIATMKSYQPVIYKLATTCNQPADGLRLLELLLRLKADGLSAIVSGMGTYGQMTRVYGSLLGNAMTFAPLDLDQQSAPGQLTRGQLETIFKQLES